MADREKQAEVRSVSDLLDEIENETLYLALVTVDRRTLQIVLLKMQGYSTKDIAAAVKLSTKSVYRRMDKLRNRLKPFKR
jgi:RNA polymerase sigma-70 factor (ECF subfamily)